VIPYATRTGTRRNLAALRAAGWRILLTPDAGCLPPDFRYAIDNGAWGAYRRNEPFNGDAFRKLVDRHGEGADWIAIPDIVGDGLRSLEFSLKWLPRLRWRTTPLFLPVQDGMEPEHLVGVEGVDGIFLGGTTDWKLRTMGLWGAAARARGWHYHVARVNTARRIHRCAASGADSFDGTSASRYVVTLAELDEARRQGALVGCV
jgi:hypothetical protein